MSLRYISRVIIPVLIKATPAAIKLHLCNSVAYLFAQRNVPLTWSPTDGWARPSFLHPAALSPVGSWSPLCPAFSLLWPMVERARTSFFTLAWELHAHFSIENNPSAPTNAKGSRKYGTPPGNHFPVEMLYDGNGTWLLGNSNLKHNLPCLVQGWKVQMDG